MTLKTTPWDSAEYLKSEADMSAYLDACFEEAGDDSAFLTHALGVVARSRNMSQLARDSGLTREGLYKALSLDGNPSFNTVLKVADAMGYRFALVRKPGKVAARVLKRTSPKESAAKQVTGFRAKVRIERRPRKSNTCSINLYNIDAEKPHPIKA